MNAFALLVGLFCAANIASAGKTCLTYEPDVVEIEGKLIRQTFPGPPNYDSIKKGDRPETYWIAVLSKPICVSQPNSTEEIDVPYEGIHRIQLAMPRGAAYKRWGTCLGKVAKVKGTLFGQITAHHKTKVLITVQEIHCG